MNNYINRLMKVKNAVKASQQSGTSSLDSVDEARLDELTKRKRELFVVGDTLNPQEFAEWRHLFHKMVKNLGITKQDCQGFASRLQAAKARRC
ncbi:hypothetical protein SPSIL_017100 [Sporomusa silvacetica DSM 10669]|uniref:Uncharacterized protein n=1 Tax=Sporomusa silvacetica DSM 10669 TaxID=1123289 RepID=A0ABZ3IIS5_9FIRM|nr:hypothetical protein [Sporomusa silvacetica]OZC18363.1 hypothetical protein SPSIL_25630 [Sporomusa silvacetica DSM 10669]